MMKVSFYVHINDLDQLNKIIDKIKECNTIHWNQFVKNTYSIQCYLNLESQQSSEYLTQYILVTISYSDMIEAKDLLEFKKSTL